MNAKFLRCSFLALFLALTASTIRAQTEQFFFIPPSDTPFLHERDPLAPRDEWGVFHQTKFVIPVDYAHRHYDRYYYWLQSGRELVKDPAYVGSLQIGLRNNGYYCGPIDGVMSEEVRDAIARLQKNHLQRVTGTLTVPVRRVLHLP